jgi:hypothetical protein
MDNAVKCGLTESVPFGNGTAEVKVNAAWARNGSGAMSQPGRRSLRVSAQMSLENIGAR